MRLAVAEFALVLLAGLSACSSPAADEDVGEDQTIITPFDDVKNDHGTRPVDGGDGKDPGDVPADDVDAGGPPDGFEIADLPDGFQPEEQDDGQQPPEEIDDVEEDDQEGPIETPYINFGPMTISMKGFILGGKFMQFRFAQVDYWKFPEDRWDYLLDMVREAGFNGVYTAACWRMHERVKGQYDFLSGRLDVAAFLDKATTHGLYIYFAAGPWIDQEAAGCLPDWVIAGSTTSPSGVLDGKYAIRSNDADYMTAVAAYLDQLNAAVVDRQVTSFPQGNIVLYQLDSKVDLFYLLRDAQGRISQEMQGVPLPPQNPGVYLSQLRDLVKQDGVNVPLLVSVTGDFENGGRHVFGTGDTTEVYPVLEDGGEDPYESLELKMWVLKKEMRNAALHGQAYMASPAIAVGALPTATHLSRLLMAGADAVVVRDFSAALRPPDHNRISMAAADRGLFTALPKAKVALGSLVDDSASPLTLSGIPRQGFFAFRMLNALMERFGTGFASRDLPYRTGPNKKNAAFSVEITNPAVGGIEDKWKWPEVGQAAGIIEVMDDHFEEWFQFPKEPTGRATYFFDSSDGSILVNLVVLDGLKDGKNEHAREDLLTKLIVNGDEVPRHSSIVVPASDDTASGEPWLGWGHKIVVLNHFLGSGYPVLEYAAANLAVIREFNGRLLIVAHGKPLVKAEGAYFTEPGELSFSQFPAIPDIALNTLPGSGVHTDSNGRIAVQFQHDGTGFLLMTLSNGKQILIMSTTSDLGRTVRFVQDVDLSEIALFGLDRVTSAQGGPEGLKIEGDARLDAARFLALVPTQPSAVKVNGKEVECTYDSASMLLDCPFTPAAPAADVLPHSAMYMKQENYSGAPAELGTSSYPEAFATASGAPLPADDPGVAAAAGVMWYTADVELAAVPPAQEGFLSIAAAADVVSVFVNGQYIGTSSPLGNTPMKASDAAMGMAAAGFRIPAGVLLQGTNNVALRVVLWGRGLDTMPQIYSMAPLLPPTLDPFSPAIPHFAIRSLDPAWYRGVIGPVKITIGAVAATLTGTWTMSRADGTGMSRILGMLMGWHNLPPDPSAAPNQGFASVSDISAQSPLLLQDGQTTWLTTTFSSDSLPVTGGAELVLEGRSAIALVFFNGTLVGLWGSDAEALSQGLHSELLQGAGTRQVLADLDYGRFYSSTDSIPLPETLLKRNGAQDNRISCILLDISPPGEADAPLPAVGTITGMGRLHRFDVRPNTDEPYHTASPDQGTPAYWTGVDIHFVAETATE